MKKDHAVVKYAFDKSLKNIKKRIMSKPNLNYAPAPTGVYSLRRLFLALQLDARLPETVKIGGRFIANQLADSGGRLELPAEFLSKSIAKPNDLLILTVLRRDLQLTPNTNSGVIKNILEVQPVVSSQAELSYPARDSSTWLGFAEFLNKVRKHLIDRGLIEVTTPSLVTNPGMEPELEPFGVEIKIGRNKRTLFLPTSPELHLKQLLAQGLTDIFEIKSVFRSEELTEIHEPEFVMLEWYRAYANLDAIVDDLIALIATLSGKSQPTPQMKIADLFLQGTDFQLKPTTTREDLLALANQLGLKPKLDEDFNNLFNYIWVDKVEPILPRGALIVRDYPPSQAALARLNDGGWADRLELYWNGVEIANAFHELNDPVEQRARFERDQRKRAEYGRTALEIDENFMSALEFGLPPSGGIALGLDRLFMMLNGLARLKDGRAFDVSHQFRNSPSKS